MQNIQILFRPVWAFNVLINHSVDCMTTLIDLDGVFSSRCMNRSTFKALHRQARIGMLGTLACSLGRTDYQWFLTEVYDLRFPHVGSERHLKVRSFDAFGRRGGIKFQRMYQ